MTLQEAVQRAIENHDNLIDAQAWLCENQFRLCPVATFKECLLAVSNQWPWTGKTDSKWRSPLKHEVTALMDKEPTREEWSNHVLGSFVVPEE